MWRQVIEGAALFGVAGVCEIGGGWLVWKWRRGDEESLRKWWLLMGGSLALIMYGVVATFQTQPFARTYAAYGGFFIGLSLLWGRLFDSFQPDLWDLIGSVVAVLGACIIMFAPRNNNNTLASPPLLTN